MTYCCFTPEIISLAMSTTADPAGSKCYSFCCNCCGNSEIYVIKNAKGYKENDDYSQLYCGIVISNGLKPVQDF